MPMNRDLYPDNWQQIRQQILDRANHKCEWCGVENYAIGARSIDGTFIPQSELEANIYNDDWYWLHFESMDYPKTFKIVLTIAHVGVPKFPGDTGDKTDKMDCRPNNLVALCQKCHLTYDIDEHVANARQTRERKIRDAGQRDFFNEVQP